MTNVVPNQQPNYSGVTINITNPAVNLGQQKPNEQCTVNYTPAYTTQPMQNQYSYSQFSGNPNLPPQYYGQQISDTYSQPAQNNNDYNNYSNYVDGNAVNSVSQVDTLPSTSPSSYSNNQGMHTNPLREGLGQTYPPQYYLNNYNYQYNNSYQQGKNVEEQKPIANKFEHLNNGYEPIYEKEDLSKSQGIIEELDERNARLTEETKNQKTKDVIALTDEYIKSLENYLNNPNQEIRLMAAKEILTRLDEDKTRADDLALNALLNKMLQDPSKVIRVAALSAFNSRLAIGNDYTVTLLQNMQSNPNTDKEDVLQAADILLKMSAGTETIKVPDPSLKESQESKKG